MTVPRDVRVSVPPTPTARVTELLHQWTLGDEVARDALVPLVYDELRRVARRCLVGQRPDHTLQSTALVHEVYIRLFNHESVRWDDRIHFFAVAAQLMRRILVDHARTRNAAKRGGHMVSIMLDEQVAKAKERTLELVALDDALTELSRMDAQQARIIEMRFFAGLSIEEVAQVLGVSPATVKRDWAVARAWLYSQLSRNAS